jgi:lysophospholipase
MRKQTFLNTLEPRFHPPAGFNIRYFQAPARGRVRYGFLRAQNERAFVVMTSGLGAPMEMDYENIRTLAEMGLSVWFLERYGEAGSDRPFKDKDRQKPALIRPSEYADDLLAFVEHIRPMWSKSPEKPLIFIGICFGCLIGLYACMKNDRLFDHCFLTSPMLGLKWANGAESEWVFPVGPETDMQYVGKARDWSWELAQKLIANDQTSHDPLRGPIRHYWLRQYPRLRLGGFTYGFIHRSSIDVVNLFEPGVLEKISTPVTLVSASEDVINDNRRHAAAAARLQNAQHYTIQGARHGLWREIDEFRNQLLGLLFGKLTQ